MWWYKAVIQASVWPRLEDREWDVSLGYVRELDASLGYVRRYRFRTVLLLMCSECLVWRKQGRLQREGTCALNKGVHVMLAVLI